MDAVTASSGLVAETHSKDTFSTQVKLNVNVSPQIDLWRNIYLTYFSSDQYAKKQVSNPLYSKTPLVIGVKITRVTVDHERDFDTN